MHVTRVHVHQKNAPQSSSGNYATWADVTNLPNLISYAGSYVDSAGQMITQSAAKPEDADSADFNTAKRRIEWKIKNFRGGQNRQLELAMTFKKGVVIDEVQFKQLSPFSCEFDVPNHTVSGIRINKMECKVLNQPHGDPNTGVEPGKWLRHKTFSGSYIFRI